MSKLNKNYDKRSQLKYAHKRASNQKHANLFIKSFMTPSAQKICSVILIVVLILCSSWYAYIKLWPPIKQYVQALSCTLKNNSSLKIDTLLVEGRHYTNPIEIQQAIGYQKNDFIFSTDPQAIKQRLEALAWVRSAIVQRKWPATVYIRLTEQQPIALWQKDRQYFLIDDCGTLIATKDLNAFKSLPIITGEEAPRNTPAFLDILEHFPLVKKRMSAATFVGKRRWDIIINDKLTVKLPENDIQDELEYLSQLIASNNFNGQNIISIDLRIADRAYFYLNDNVLKNKAIASLK